MTINNYIEEHSEAEDPVLKELNRETNLKILRPRMLSGHIQGKILEQISKMINPKIILEIGTYTGYSAICLAKGLQENGILHTIEINDEIENFIKKYIQKAGLQKKIKLHIGDANKIVPSINDMIDLVFIDADKPQYIDYYNLVFDKVKKGGYIIADNVLWSNKVIKKIDKNDTQTKGIIDFNNYVHNDDRVENVIFPVRDGLMILRKK